MDAATPERLWREKAPGREPLGRWLVDRVPRGASLAIPRGARESRREIPFASGRRVTGVLLDTKLIPEPNNGLPRA